MYIRIWGPIVKGKSSLQTSHLEHKVLSASVCRMYDTDELTDFKLEGSFPKDEAGIARAVANT
jgi:deoxyadenosine/deoxycytidine kinase